MRLWRHPGHLLWAMLAYLPLLGWMSVPLTGDQKVYLSTSMEMLQRDSWLKPYLFGETSYYKPPLQYWATIVGWKIFGFNLWGSLLPSFAAALLTAWLLGEIAGLLSVRRPFINAGLWFMATLGAITYGTTAQMEIYLCLFFAASWWAGLKFLADSYEVRKSQWLHLAFILAGLGALVKSPLYSVLWVMGYLSYLVVMGEWDLFRQKRLWLAWLSGAAIGALWYLVILKVDGDRFLSDYLLRETWEKKSGNQGTPLSLWIALAYLCFPFTLMLIPSFRSLRRSGKRARGLLRFVACWAWPPALFFTFYPYRVKTYLFVLAPLMALVLDLGYFRGGRTFSFRVWTRISGAIFGVVLILAGLILFRAGFVPGWVALGFAITGISGWACAEKDWFRGFALAGLAAVFFFRVGAVWIGEKDLAPLREIASAHPGAAMAMIDENKNVWHEVGLLSVALGRQMERLSGEQEAAVFLRKGGLLVLSDEQVAADQARIAEMLRVGGESRRLVAKPWPRFRAKTKFPVKDLILHGRAGVPDFERNAMREFGVLGLE